MVRACSAINCSLRDTPENRANGISFHKFPKELNQRLVWARATRREGGKKGSVWVPSEFSYLCSNHFTSSDFEVLQKTRRLRIDSVPSIFIFPDHHIS